MPTKKESTLSTNTLSFYTNESDIILIVESFNDNTELRMLLHNDFVYEDMAFDLDRNEIQQLIDFLQLHFLKITK